MKLQLIFIIVSITYYYKVKGINVFYNTLLSTSVVVRNNVVES